MILTKELICQCVISSLTLDPWIWDR